MRPFAALLATSVMTLTVVASISGHAAEAYPSKPVRFIMPVAAGASADIAARTLAERLAKTWKTPVIVDNRPGGGTTVATHAIAAAPADGYTFGWVITAHAINPALYPKLPYDTLRDFAGVTLVYQLRCVIVTAPNSPLNTVSDLIAQAKAKPGALVYASPATGSATHLLGELLKLKHGIDMTHIGYKGGASAHPDVMSGRVPLMFDTLPGAIQHIQSGKLKVIALISEQPVAGFENLPVLPGLLPAGATAGWNGIVVPARTPRPIVAKLNADIIAAIRSAEVQEKFRSLTVETITNTPEKFDEFIREDVARWADVIKRAGIKLDAGG